MVFGLGEVCEMPEALSSGLKSGEFGGHWSFEIKSVQFTLNQSGEM